MSEYEEKEKKKSRDIFGAIGDGTYEWTKSYYGFWFDMWNYKYGLIGAVLAVIYFFGPSIFTNGYLAMIIFGLALAYTLVHYYVYEIEADEESSLHKFMNFMNTLSVIAIICIALYFAIPLLFYSLKEAGVMK